MLYKQYLQTDYWKDISGRRKRTKRKCFVCKSTETLDVHHLFYRKWFTEKITDLKVMCRRCHFTTHALIKNEIIKFKKNDHRHMMSVIIKTLRGNYEKYAHLLDREQVHGTHAYNKDKQGLPGG